MLRMIKEPDDRRPSTVITQDNVERARDMVLLD